MKQANLALGRDSKRKQAIVAALFTGAMAITASGVWFAVYSVTGGISFKVMNTSIPGIVLALLVIYFGIRSFMSVSKLSKEILKETSFFSWSNFKRVKPAKSR